MQDLGYVRCHMPHHFDIARSGSYCWRVTDREGLVGGVFRTRKAALRFALFEADGDRRYVHFSKPR